MRYYLFTTLSLIMFLLAISAIVVIQINPQDNLISQIFLFFLFMTLSVIFFKMKIASLKEIIQKIKEQVNNEYI